MIAGAPAGLLAGDPVDQGSLARVLNNDINNEIVTFGNITPAYLSTLKSVIRDSTTVFVDPVSPLTIGNTSLNYEARYIFPQNYITIDPLLKDPSAGLILNRITSDTSVGIPKFSSLAFPTYLRNGGFQTHMVNKKQRFDSGRCPNGN